MVMRYHRGLAIGHIYNHGPTTDTRTSTLQPSAADDGLEPELDAAADVNPDSHFPHYNDSDAEDPELGFEDREADLIDAGDGFEDELEDELEVDYDNDLLVTMDEMYDLSEPQGYYD
jgi:hypothetical protein